MAFRKNDIYLGKMTYSPGGISLIKLPPGNLFTNIKFLLKTKINIATNPGSNVPDFQVMRLAREVQLLRGEDVKWSVSGEQAAAVFSIINGTNASGNAAMAGTVATNVTGQHYLEFPLSPFDAAKPQDFMLDTRGQEWSLKIVWRDATVAGTFFGTIGGTVAVTSNDDNYFHVEAERVDLTRTDAATPDVLEKSSPLLRTINGNVASVTVTKNDFQIDLTKPKAYRNILLWTTHETNSNQEVGVNTVLTDKITIKNTNGTVFGVKNVEMLREKTSQTFGVGSNLPGGLYHIPLIQFGSVLDALLADNSNQIYMEMAVAKLTNTTRIHVITDAQIKQNG